MAVTTPPAVSALPTPPSTASPSTFDTRADAFLTALPTFQTENNAVATNVFANATDAAASATTATTQAGTATAQAVIATANAVAAAANAGAILWVSGTTYAIGDKRASPANSRIYARKTSGAGTTDPSADATNWQIVDAEMPTVTIAGTTQTMAVGVRYITGNAAATALTAPASPASGDEICYLGGNGRLDNTIDFGASVVQGPNGVTLTGVMTMDLGPWRGKYSSTLSKWVQA